MSETGATPTRALTPRAFALALVVLAGGAGAGWYVLRPGAQVPVAKPVETAPQVVQAPVVAAPVVAASHLRFVECSDGQEAMHIARPCIARLCCAAAPTRQARRGRRL